MEEHSGEVAQGAGGRAVVVAACRRAGDLGFDEGVHVAAEGDDRGFEAAFLAHGGELLGCTADDGAGDLGGLQLFERRVDPDGLEVEEDDTGDRGDVGVDVARQAEVDDELGRGVRHGALRRGFRDDVVDELRDPGGLELGGRRGGTRYQGEDRCVLRGTGAGTVVGCDRCATGTE